LSEIPPSSTGEPREFGIVPVTIEDEMRRSYLDYAMSVIIARALPDVRDGLKPVHRRILYAMKEAGYDWNRAYRKSARIVGDVMGQYHPHGGEAIYDAMVRMAQPWSMRAMLIDGQGNFGSIDGDPPAAMRYTEARLARLASEAMLADIDEDTVDFQPNYDETAQEPQVLPSRLPNLLVNGAGGIAVGMATNIAPHNLGEVIDACCALVDDPSLPLEELMRHVKGPDFPTGGVVVGRRGILEAYRTGRGTITLRGRATVEEAEGKRERSAIIITEIPFQTSKARLIERIAEVVRDREYGVEGISDLRDESDRQGLRIVVELKRDVQGDVVLNQLYQHTPLQSSFGFNMLAIDGRRPRLFSLKEMLLAFVRFREEVITRRTVFRLGKARERAHVLVGLAIAVANIDEVVGLIRSAADPNAAREGLMRRAWPAGDVASLVALIDEPGHRVDEGGTYRLSEAQARAILELRLQRLTGLERDKIAEELEGLAAEIREHLAVLASREKLLTLLKSELVEVKQRYGDARRTELEDADAETDIEDLIQREEMVVTLSHTGWIKRVPLSAYRAQRRGGKGRSAMATKETDFVSQLFSCSTHTPVLFFSSTGMVYRLKVWRLPLGSPQSRGKPLINLLPLAGGETITACLPLPEDAAAWAGRQLIFATSAGTVRRNRLTDFANIRQSGLIAMKLEEGVRLVAVRDVAWTEADEQDAAKPRPRVLLVTAGGKAIKFPLDDVRLFEGRASFGVRGIRLAKGDSVIDMSVLESEEALLLSVADDGLGRLTPASEFRETARGGQGIANLDLRRSGGGQARVVATFPVGLEDELMLVTDAGTMIRCPVEGIRIASRATRGVRILDVAEGERVVSVTGLADEGATGADGGAAEAG
jgi:DNA gyrase subunit A